MTSHELHRKYAEYSDTLARPSEELAKDFATAHTLVSSDPNSGEMVSLSVVRDWIALERRMRIPGLGRALAA